MNSYLGFGGYKSRNLRNHINGVIDHYSIESFSESIISTEEHLYYVNRKKSYNVKFLNH